ncbi:hypothetical protein [Pseudarthrobacter sp. TAF60_1]|uniref:hypothetical protein n=1 Tax=Pseudarthrobacter sp. TAF60_1 TaxID=3233071 RepID=UPI003F9A36EA
MLYRRFLPPTARRAALRDPGHWFWRGTSHSFSGPLVLLSIFGRRNLRICRVAFGDGLRSKGHRCRSRAAHLFRGRW